jgi:hypothetical protein
VNYSITYLKTYAEFHRGIHRVHRVKRPKLFGFQDFTWTSG